MDKKNQENIIMNLFTIRQARNRQCPHRLEWDGNCIATECMGWRQMVTADGPMGFCGLAGDPRIAEQIHDIKLQIHDIKLDINAISQRPI